VGPDGPPEQSFSTHYVTQHHLGEGAFSEVKQCVDKRSHDVFAVKIVLKKMIPTQEEEKALRSEIAILKDLHHDHIIALKDHIEGAFVAAALLSCSRSRSCWI